MRTEHHTRMFATRSHTLVAELLAHVDDRLRLRNSSSRHLSTALGGTLSLAAAANRFRSSARNEFIVVSLLTRRRMLEVTSIVLRLVRWWAGRKCVLPTAALRRNAHESRSRSCEAENSPILPGRVTPGLARCDEPSPFLSSSQPLPHTSFRNDYKLLYA